jgi:hypothetical protein
MRFRKKGLGSESIIVILSITFFLIYGCGKQKEPASSSQPTNQPESSMEQKEFIQFPDLGVLEVKAQAIEEQLPSLVIRDASKKKLLKIEMGNTYSDTVSFQHSAGIEFKVFHIIGLPDPLLMVIALGPGGSDNLWEMTLIGVVSGQIIRIWKQSKKLFNAGGLFVGDLGKGRGIGIAQWDWRSSECHSCEPDEYRIKLYLWNKENAQFVVGPEFTFKKNRFDEIEKLGLSFPDQRGNFKRLQEKLGGGTIGDVVK